MKALIYLLALTQALPSPSALAQQSTGQPLGARAPIAAPAPIIKFSPTEQDQITINDRLRHNDPAAYDFAALVYSVNGASQAHDLQNLQVNMGRWNPPTPMEFLVGTDSRPQNFSKEEFLNRAATQQNDALQGFKIRGTVGEPIIASALGLLSPELGAAAPVLLPVMTDGAIRFLERPPTDPGFSADFARSYDALGLDQIRRGTPEGKVLENYRIKLNLPDPNSDRSDTPAVREAQQLRLSIEQSKNIDEIMSSQKKLPEVVSKLDQQFAAAKDILKSNANLGRSFANPAEEATERVAATMNYDPSLAEFFRDGAEALTATSYIMTLANRPDDAVAIQKIAMASKAMQILNSGKEMSGFAVGGIYLYAAVMIYSAIKISSQPASPFPALFAMLKQISKQIEDLRHEMGVRFNQLDGKLSVFAEQSLAYSENNFQQTLVINRVLDQLQTQMRVLQSQVVKSSSAVVDVMLDGEDRLCFIKGDGPYANLDPQTFIKCRNTYIDRATKTSRSPLAHDVVDSAAIRGAYTTAVFPSSDRYETLRQIFDHGGAEYPNPLAHPSMWYQGASLLARLGKNQPKDLSLFADNLEDVVNAGNDLRKFRETLLFKGVGIQRRLRMDRLQTIANRISRIQSRALDRVEKQLSAPGTTVAVNRGIYQPVNQSWKFDMFNDSIKFCPEIQPRLMSYDQVAISYPGGGGGYIDMHKNDGTDHGPFVRAPIAAGSWGSTIDVPMNTITPEQLQWDKATLLAVLNKEMLLLEQSTYLKTKVAACISQMDINKLNQAVDTSFTADIDIGLKVFVTYDEAPNGLAGPFAVQELKGTLKMVGKPNRAILFKTYSHLHELFLEKFASLMPQLPKLLKDVSAKEALTNRQVFTKKLNGYFEAKQNDLLIPILNSINEDDDAFLNEFANLRAMFAIGLSGSRQVTAYWNSLATAYLNGGSPTFLAHSALTTGNTIAGLRDQVLTFNKRMNDGFAWIARQPRIGPRDDVLAGPVQDLGLITWLNKTPAALRRQ